MQDVGLCQRQVNGRRVTGKTPTKPFLVDCFYCAHNLLTCFYMHIMTTIS